MLKLFACMAIVCSGALTGAYYSRRLIRRRDTLSQFLGLLHKASVLISYQAAELSEVFRDNFAGFAFDRDQPFDEQWMRLVERYRHILSEKDREILRDFVGNMGVTDTESQHKHIVLYCQLLTEHLEESKEAVSRKCKLYQVLPLSAALVLSLLLM